MQVQVPPELQFMGTDASVQVIASTITVFILRALKNSQKCVWVSQNSRSFHLLSVLGAIITSAGIHLKFDQAEGQLLITGLTGAASFHMLVDFCRAYSFNHILNLISEIHEKLHEVDNVTPQDSTGR